MLLFTTLRTALLALVGSLLVATSVQAQQAGTSDMLTASASSPVHRASLADQPVDFSSETAASSTPLKLSVPPPSEVMSSYSNSSKKDISKALAWIAETNAYAPTYWNMYAEASIRFQMQDYAGARATAEKAQKLALAASPSNQEYAQLSGEVAAKAWEHLKLK